MTTRSFPALVPEGDLRGFTYNAGGRCRTSRIAPLETVIESAVQSGMTIHYPWLSTRASAALFEVVRQARAGRLADLTIASTSIRAEIALLVASRGVRRIVTSFAASSHPAIRPNPAFSRALAEESIELEEWSLLAIVQRTLAGALGWPFVPATTMQGTDLPSGVREGLGTREVKDPFNHVDTLLMPALTPDVCLVHCPVADWEGNGVLFEPLAEGVHPIYAATEGVVVTADIVVSPDELRRWSGFVKVPASRVIGLAQVPLGAHPNASHVPVGIGGVSGYGEDYDFHTELGALRSEGDLEAFCQRWIDPPSRDSYLSQLGSERIKNLVTKDLDESWQVDWLAKPPSSAPTSAPSVGERLAVAGANALADLAHERAARTVIAGAGISSLAAALGRIALLDAGIEVDLVFESGVVGYVPRPYDSTLSNTRNLPTARQLNSTLEVLGMLAQSENTSTIAILAAGAVDQGGNANSNRVVDGRFLVGGGGSTDIVGRVKTVVVVPADARRFLRRVPFITYPGENVAAIATDVGVLAKSGDTYVLSTWFTDCANSVNAALDLIRDRIGWEVRAADTVRPIDPPRPDEREFLRMIDPEGNLLG